MPRGSRRTGMTLKRALLVLVLTALATLAGCGDNADSPEPNILVPAGNLGATYVVTGVTVDGKPHALVEGTEIRIRFAEDQVTLTAGCNTMSGNYTPDGTRLSVDSLATTDMGCNQARMEQDTWLAGLFEAPVQLTTEGDATIVAGSTVLTLTDREKASPDRPLEGTDWVLDTVGDGQVASSLPEGKSERLRVSAGKVEVHNGCSTLDATGTVSGEVITWGPGRSTLDLCSSSVAMFAEGEQVGWSIDERTLTLTGHDLSLGFTAVD